MLSIASKVYLCGVERANLYREYARVIEMCANTSVHPDSCVKVNGHVWRDVCVKAGLLRRESALIFDGGEYIFAVSIDDDKPVFKI